ncbi:MAG: 1-acyl-sn-glycerol-3-phosphate acyltransferase [Limisphaerales bacterium]|jgi:1-acyl-sn-glycerol-3-phosphate acyltransferase
MYRFLRTTMRVVLRVFVRRIYVTGKENLPVDSPIIFACNHTNAFFDAVLTTCEIKLKYCLHFMTRADIFKPPWLPLLNSMNLIPVYRMRDGRANLSKNEGSFEATTQVLSENKSILIFSEGICIPEKRVQRLLKGTARIAFKAYEAGLEDLMIVPVGINYSEQTKFRMDVMLNYGRPIPVKKWIAQYKLDEAKTINEFNTELRSKLIEKSHHIENPENDKLFAELVSFDTNEDKQWHSTDKTRFEQQKNRAKQIENTNGDLSEHLKTDLARYAALRKKLGLSTEQVAPNPPAYNLSFVLATIVYLTIWPITLAPLKGADWLVEYKVKAKMFKSSIRMTAGMLFYANWIILLTVFLSFWFGWMSILFFPIPATLLGLYYWQCHDTIKQYLDWRIWRSVEENNKVEAAELVFIRAKYK